VVDSFDSGKGGSHVGGCPRSRPSLPGHHRASGAGFIFAPDYLGIHRSKDCVFIQVTLNAGRTVNQKSAFYKAIADGLHERLGLRREDVFISLVEVSKENWSFGNGEAQYAK
jgi:phenylpyruvate tautomerase PptA (4-oxalocrotonate tautomerase family)